MAADSRGFAFGKIKGGIISKTKSGFYQADVVVVDMDNICI